MKKKTRMANGANLDEGVACADPAVSLSVMKYGAQAGMLKLDVLSN